MVFHRRLGGIHMYIEPFWCGVIATVISEIAVLVAIGLIAVHDDYSKKHNDED